MARAKASSVEAKLAALRDAPALADLRDALRSSTGVLVAAAAARIVADPTRDHLALVADFGAAFDRLCERPVQRDPGCRGKLALVEALYELDRWDAVFERAVAYVQAEPQWGGSSDSAAALRGLCGLAFAHFMRPDALDVLAQLLADPERATRATAAQALGNTGRPDATALLRFKLLVGDADVAVLAPCFESLLALAKDDALGFIDRFLGAHDERAEVAIVALGTSHLAAALPRIAAWTERALAEQRRRVGYLALALLRLEPATAQLLDLVATGHDADAIAAAAALATFRDDPTLRARLVAAAAQQRDRTARAEIERALAPRP